MNSDPTPSALQPTRSSRKRILVGGIVLTAIFLAGLLIVYFSAQTGKIFVRPDWARKLGLPTATLACLRPTLTLGATSFPLEAVARPADGSLPAAGEAGIAWWVSDTYSPFVFLLKPAGGSPDLQSSLEPGDAMLVQWADCGREEFVLAAVPPGAPDAQALLAGTTAGIAVIVQPDEDVAAYVLLGERPVQTVVETPEPTDPNAIQADISFGETSISEDGKTLHTSLTITNTGSKPIVVAPADISLTVEGKQPLDPLSVEPGLPLTILPGENATLAMTFSNPGGNLATLRILDFVVDLYY